MRTSLPVRVERLWWVRRLRRLLRSLGTLPLVLDSHGQVRTLPQQLRQLRDIRRNPLRLVFGGQLGRALAGCTAGGRGSSIRNGRGVFLRCQK